MSNISLNTFFFANSVSIVMLGFISAFFFNFLRKNSTESQKKICLYFMANYILLAFGLIATYLRAFGLEVLSILVTNLLYTVSAYCLWHGIAYRNGKKVAILKNKWMYINIVVILLVNFCVFYLYQDNFLMRVSLLTINTSLITCSHLFFSSDYFKTNKKPGDRLLKFILVIVPLTNILSLFLSLKNVDYYLISVMPLQVIQTFLLSMALTAILMLDVVDKHYQASITDQLSGLYNRRFFETEAKTVLNNPQRSQMAVMICDLDDFKVINDTYGHSVGDLVIQATSSCIKQTFKHNCIYSRYGGEEFVVLCMMDDRDKALDLANIFREMVATTSISYGNHSTIKATISVGVHFIESNDKYDDDNVQTDKRRDIQYYLQKADEALYQAKNSGKNKVCIV